MVPRARTAGSPMPAARAASPGYAPAPAATSACEVDPPTHSAPSSAVQMPCISEMPLRLTNLEGLARRCFMVGSNVCPPPRACASSEPSADTASAIVEGFSKSKLYILFPPPIRSSPARRATATQAYRYGECHAHQSATRQQPRSQQQAANQWLLPRRSPSPQVGCEYRASGLSDQRRRRAHHWPEASRNPCRTRSTIGRSHHTPHFQATPDRCPDQCRRAPGHPQSSG
mmetsp:Transcript_24095/g.44655  ORF Transcript_24095/g.44655 Transcript_24095/m.44655 type:complete len:229 (-) Transcript_24095:4839-5525(-)